MPVCSYVVVPRPGRTRALCDELARIDGIEVVPAENANLLLLVTSVGSAEGDAALRRRVEETPGIQALLMTFGEVDPETPLADPLAAGKHRPQTSREAGKLR